MAWTIEFDEKAERDLAKLEKSIQKRIRRYLADRVATTDDPRSLGYSLGHGLAHLWRFRVQNYRIVRVLVDDRIVVLVVAIGHRSSIYER